MKKIKRLLPVHCSGSFSPLRPQVFTDGGDVERTNQNISHLLLKNCHLSGYQKHRQQHKTREITATATEARSPSIIMYIRVSAAKVRFAQSKFSYVQTQRRGRKDGKCVVETNSKVTSSWVVWPAFKTKFKVAPSLIQAHLKTKRYDENFVTAKCACINDETIFN